MIHTIFIHPEQEVRESFDAQLGKWREEEYYRGNIIEMLKFNRYIKHDDMNIYFDIEYRINQDTDYLKVEERLKIGL